MQSPETKESVFRMSQRKSDFGYIYRAVYQRGACHDRARGRNERPKVTPGTASAFGGVSDRLYEYGIPAPVVQTDLPVSRMEGGLKRNTASNRNTACMFV